MPPEFLRAGKENAPFLIAEIKKASPSKGLIRENFNVAEIAEAYQKSASVDAISILTEPDFFYGSYENIRLAAAMTDKPILMKDFIIDPYQIYKGFILGASAVLVIASVTDDLLYKKFKKITDKLNMGILFEVHTIQEYKRALRLGADKIGINNRNLKTFVTDINNTIMILEKAGKPGGTAVISESGINTRDDITRLMNCGVDGFLIGERFMKEQDICLAIRDLFGK
jgi:indole-3-glycerol phosphate synthase